ncbi:hypothetical protein C8J57DRAFT_1235488 [Mycena rebaudengoi]|nr:hypothetical protein C8J57DRAFT_1235488 [Mycena rebaudengoi]
MLCHGMNLWCAEISHKAPWYDGGKQDNRGNWYHGRLRLGNGGWEGGSILDEGKAKEEWWGARANIEKNAIKTATASAIQKQRQLRRGTGARNGGPQWWSWAPGAQCGKM